MIIKKFKGRLNKYVSCKAPIHSSFFAPYSIASRYGSMIGANRTAYSLVFMGPVCSLGGCEVDSSCEAGTI